MAMRHLILALSLTLALPAHAFDDFHWGEHPGYSKAKRGPKAPRVKAWVMHDKEPPPLNPPPPLCMSPVMVQGLQGITEKGAEEKARDAWAAKVRTSLGERFMDLRFAAGLRKRCFRSSVGDNVLKSAAANLGERVGIMSDGANANDAAEYRCDIFAAPCEPPWIDRGEPVKGASPGAPQ